MKRLPPGSKLSTVVVLAVYFVLHFSIVHVVDSEQIENTRLSSYFECAKDHRGRTSNLYERQDVRVRSGIECVAACQEDSSCTVASYHSATNQCLFSACEPAVPFAFKREAAVGWTLFAPADTRKGKIKS